MIITKRKIKTIALIIMSTIGFGCSIYGLTSIDPDRKKVKITHISWGAVMIEHKGKRIYIDPYNIPENYSDLKADAIFITHDHVDHLDKPTINLIEKRSTVLLGPNKSAYYNMFFDGINVEPLQNGTVEGFSYETLPLYNLNSPIHDFNKGNIGYLLHLGDLTVFYAGDSDNIPEYDLLIDRVDVAMIPITKDWPMMSYQDGLDFINRIHPKYVIPIHIYNENVTQFQLDVHRLYPNTECIISDFPLILV
ncbi:MBL fold metallo-hydrolase [Candidatus Lokiarchaeum ossiferum]|uniref:MBL fold metallo-hydrolase n=1 Tax=Candidatus Lokiarchaeum ossiferum TaxID=2951803 RepID=UPI00352F35AD